MRSGTDDKSSPINLSSREGGWGTLFFPPNYPLLISGRSYLMGLPTRGNYVVPTTPTHQPGALRGGAVGLPDGRLVEAGLVDRVAVVAELRPPPPSAQSLAECDAIPMGHDVVQDRVDGAVDEVRQLESLWLSLKVFGQRQLEL